MHNCAREKNLAGTLKMLEVKILASLVFVEQSKLKHAKDLSKQGRVLQYPIDVIPIGADLKDAVALAYCASQCCESKLSGTDEGRA